MSIELPRYAPVIDPANSLPDVEITISDDPPIETPKLPLWKRTIKWFVESGDPKRPSRWKRFSLLGVTCGAAVASRILTKDTLILNAASLLSAVQVNAEIYNWSNRNKLIFLTAITTLTTLGEMVFFPNDPLLHTISLSGMCWALNIRTFSIESQKWININAAQNK